MRDLRCRLLGAAVLLTVAGSVMAATAGAAEAGRTVAQTITLARGPLPVHLAFKLKAEMGEATFAAEASAAAQRLLDRTEKTDRCASGDETRAAAQLALVRLTRDVGEYTKSKAAAEDALEERQRLKALYLDGADAPPPYGLVSRMAARAKMESNPRLAALYRRMAEDQFSRIDSITLRQFFGAGVHTTWERGLGEAGLAYVDAIVSSEWCPLKVSAAAWLKADIRQHGWYTISVYGADADRAAWTIVQHARHDRAFQREVLRMLEPLWERGETRGENYALLYDQTAYYEGRPGRFGVMGECTAPGVWTPAPLEDRGATDAWRARAGMPPFAQYAAIRNRGCID